MDIVRVRDYYLMPLGDGNSRLEGSEMNAFGRKNVHTLPECKEIGVGCAKVIMDSLLERMPDFQFLLFQNSSAPIIIQRMRLNVST